VGAFDEVDGILLVHASPRALLDCCLAGGGWWPIRTVRSSRRVTCRSCRSAAEIERLPPFGRESERHRDRSKAYGEGTGVQPSVGVGGVVHEPAGPWPQRHAEA